MGMIFLTSGRGSGMSYMHEALKVLREEELRACKEEGKSCKFGICSECENQEDKKDERI